MTFVGTFIEGDRGREGNGSVGELGLGCKGRKWRMGEERVGREN